MVNGSYSSRFLPSKIMYMMCLQPVKAHCASIGCSRATRVRGTSFVASPAPLVPELTVAALSRQSSSRHSDCGVGPGSTQRVERTTRKKRGACVRHARRNTRRCSDTTPRLGDNLLQSRRRSTRTNRLKPLTSSARGKPSTLTTYWYL